jgi:CSLREA domain-containing protein
MLNLIRGLAVKKAIVVRALFVALSLVLPMVLVGTAMAGGGVCTVNSTEDTANGTTNDNTNTGTLRYCLTQTNQFSGGTIGFSVTGTITLTSALPAIITNLTIQGPRANQLTISGNNQFTVFTINSGTVVISGLTIANGSGNNPTPVGLGVGGGGGILNLGGTLTVSNSTFTDNTTPIDGGGIFNSFGSTLTVINSTFFGNSASNIGGGILNAGTLTVSNSTFSGNSARVNGGGIDNLGITLVVSNSILSGNHGGQCADASVNGDLCPAAMGNGNVVGGNANLLPLGNYGGATETLLPLPGSPAICAGSSSLVPSGVTTDQRGFPLDTSCVDAGAVQTNYLLVNTTSDSNDVSCTSATCSLRDAITAANSSTMQDISFSPTVFTATPPNTVSPIVLSTSLPALSGQINIVGPAASTAPAVTSVTVSGNHSSTVGSIFMVDSGAQVFLYGLTIANGNSPAAGGGINALGGTLTVTNSTFSGNTANNTDGGAIFFTNAGTLTVTNSTFSGNTAGSGGAIFTNTDMLTVTNSTFSGNTANIGGGIQFNNIGTMTVSNSIFSGNSAPGSGDIFSVATVNAEGHNLFYNNTGESSNFTLSNTDATGVDPMLLPLSNYGGITQTMLPLPGSSAICAGLTSLALNASGNPLTIDQRGFVRTTSYGSAGTCVDEGAVQTDYTSVQFTNGPSYSEFVSVAVVPAPVVSVTENGQNIGGIPITLALSGTSTTAAGLGPVSTASGMGASFGGLVVSVAGDDTLSVSLPITAVGNAIQPPALTASALLDVAQQPSLTSVSASPTVATPVQTVTLTAVVSATIAGTVAVPSGMVTFYDNGTQVGTAPLSGGTATLVVPSLPAGATATITAMYSGDGNFLPSTSTNNPTVVVAQFGFTFTNTGTAAYTAAPGAMASYNFEVTPLYGSYAAPVSFAVTGLPAGATASFTPNTVAVNGGATPVVMTVQTASATAHNSNPFGRGIVLALLLLPFAGRRSVREKMKGRMLLLVLLMAGLTATLTGCGSNSGFMLQSPQTYTLTVTATSGTLQNSQTVTLIVQ